MQKYTNDVAAVGSDGKLEPLSNASVTVYDRGTTTLATIYSDNGVTTTSNPTTTSLTGRVSFYAADGRYDILISKTGYNTVFITDILLEDPAEGISSDATNISFTQAGTGAILSTVDDKLNQFVSVTDFGADKTGVIDSATAIANARTAVGLTGSLLVPAGTYLSSGTTYNVGSDFVWNNSNYAGGVSLLATAQNANILYTTETDATTGAVDGTKSRVGIAVTARAYGSQHSDGIRSNMFNYSTDGDGNTAVYAHGVSTGTTTFWTAALHGETRHAGGISIGLNSESASYEATGTLIGLVVHNSTSGAGATHSITGAPATLCTNAYGINLVGTNDANNSDPKGAWLWGIFFDTGAMRENGISINIASQAKVSTHLQTGISSPASLSDILLQGQSNYGIILNSVYKNGAIRLANDQLLLFNSNATIGMKFDTAAGTSRLTFRGGLTDIAGVAQSGGASTITLAAGASAIDNDPTYVGHVISINSGTGAGQQRVISSYVGATKVATVSSAWTTTPNSTSNYSIRASNERVGFTVSASPTLHLNSTQVVATRQTGWGTPTATQDKTTFANGGVTTFTQVEQRLSAIINVLITHGLIGA